MPINLSVGKTYKHKTLGLIKLILHSDNGTQVEVLTNKITLDSDQDWIDDWGYAFRDVGIGSQWCVKTSFLKEIKVKIDPKDKGKSPVQIRCRKLWNESKWVKQNPNQAY